jgi:hypothetical protein
MDILTTAVPQWVSILFIIAFCIPIIVTANLAKQGAINANLDGKKYFNLTILFYVIFLGYTAALSFTGILKENTLPPKIFLFTTIPVLIFYNLLCSFNKNWKNILVNITLPSLIRFHIIRFIGVFFIITYYFGSIPKAFAIPAAIGDMLAAFLAIFVAKMVEQKKKNYKQITIAWNILGLLDILNVVVSGIFITKLSLDGNSQSLANIAEFPFCFIPAFAPATIIFIHVAIFKKLRKEKFAEA